MACFKLLKSKRYAQKLGIEGAQVSREMHTGDRDNIMKKQACK